MIKLEITADTPADLRKQLAELLGGNSQTAIANIPENEYGKRVDAPLAEPAKRGRPKKEEPAADTSKATEPTTSETVGSADADQPDGDQPITYDTHIKPAILKVSAHPVEQGGGREGVLALLAKHNVDHASKLSAEQYPAVLAEITELLGA